MDELGLHLTMSRTKTTGADKTVQERRGFVAWEAWVADNAWLKTGWDLWEQEAPWSRDYYLVVPSREGGCVPRELPYAEYAGRMRSLIASIPVDGYGPAGAHVATYWQPHSWRAFLPSAMSAVGAPATSLGWLAAWSPKGGAVYVRTQRERTRLVQLTVARILRAHMGGDDPVGERAGVRGLVEHLARRGLSTGDIDIIEANIRQYPGSPVNELLWPRLLEETREASDEPPADAQEDRAITGHSDEEVEAVTWSDGYVVSISSNRRVRRLHKLGLCYRRPGVHYRRYEELGTELPGPDSYNEYCRDCWKAGEPSSCRDGASAEDPSGSDSDSSTSSSAGSRG